MWNHSSFRLTSLRLELGSFTDQRELIAALSRLPSLESLRLSNPRMTLYGDPIVDLDERDFFGQIIESCPKLHTLDLCELEIDIDLADARFQGSDRPV